MRRSTFPTRNKGPCTVHLVPYSEHSSYEELREYVRFLKPHQVRCHGRISWIRSHLAWALNAATDWTYVSNHPFLYWQCCDHAYCQTHHTTEPTLPLVGAGDPDCRGVRRWRGGREEGRGAAEALPEPGRRERVEGGLSRGTHMPMRALRVAVSAVWECFAGAIERMSGRTSAAAPVTAI